ncbi:small subunit ribosomal protein S3Ae [Nematocida homosporus]|uniref:small subunit ribosomal protein S3Ae n=1 Tax=Nematocida homosporus TaxID=1912981 RepID=UPI0022209CF3|nr:small subunit ribosomal protein S3Ae [Nematocida homosporus]KAI5184996.1 small subunit ribosomal protein S3Ae [Nematocida homosporus]
MAGKGKAKVSSVTSKMKSKKLRSKKSADTMEKKEFYNLVLPSFLGPKEAGLTFIDKSQGTYYAPDALKGRTFEVNQADLGLNSTTTTTTTTTSEGDQQAIRKFKFVVEGVRGKDAMSSFYGMELISDKIKSIPKKWHTLIEACLKVETSDGYLLRVFTIANTKRKPKAVKKNCYASLAQVKAIRQIIFKIIAEELEGCSIQEVMKKLMGESIGSRIEQETLRIYPLQSCHVKKVKVVKRPKVEEGQYDSKQRSKRVDMVADVPCAAE